MTKLLWIKRCDFCGRWSIIPIGWIEEENSINGIRKFTKDYCTLACQEHKTYKFEGRNDLH